MMRWLTLLMCMSAVARAQAPDADALAAGKREFERARTELNLGHYEQARTHFEASYRLTARPALLYNLGYVERKLFERTRREEHLVQAAERLRAFLRAFARDDDPANLAARARAENELREIEELQTAERVARARGEETLAIAEGLWRDGKLEPARRELQRFMSGEGNQRSGLVRALMLEGALASAGGDGAAAERAFSRALALAPDAALPQGASAETQRVYQSVRTRAAGGRALAVDHTPPGSLSRGQPVQLGFKLNGDGHGVVSGFRLSYRAGRAGAFSTLERDTVAAVNLPQSFTSTLLPGAQLQYYGELLGPNRSILEHLGTAALPFAIDVGQLPRPGVARRWWFWVATIGAVAVAGTAVGLGVRYGLPTPTRIPLETNLLQ
jgi:tetratricopeptide (TPR) repeat protein